MDQTIEIKPPPAIVDQYKKGFIKYLNKIEQDIIIDYSHPDHKLLLSVKSSIRRLANQLISANKYRERLSTKKKRIENYFEDCSNLKILNYLLSYLLLFPPEKRFYLAYIDMLSILNTTIQKKQEYWLSLISNTVNNFNETIERSKNLDIFSHPFSLLESFISEVIVDSAIEDRAAFIISELRSLIVTHDEQVSKYTYQDIKVAREQAWQIGWEARSQHENNIDRYKGQWLTTMELED